MLCSLLNVFITACSFWHLSFLRSGNLPFRRALCVLLLLFPVFAKSSSGKSVTVPSKPGDSPSFAKVGSGLVFADLREGDSRDVVLKKLKAAKFREIHEEKEKRLIRCAAKLNGFRYELACKLDEDGKLLLCLLEGSKGWQFSFYDETLEPQWSNLREILSTFYGPKRSSRPLPPLHKVPMGDPGGYVTDTWELQDRIVLLTVQAFQVKDCCTKRMVDYSGCTLLIQPK